MPGSTWTAWGFLGAKALPVSMMDLSASVRIERVDAERRKQLTRDGPVLKHPELAFPQYFSALPPDLIVRSDWVVWIRTKAASFEEAWEHVVRVELPPIVAAFAGLGDMPPRIEILRMGLTDSTGFIPEVRSRWAFGTFGGFDTRELTTTEARAVASRFTVARHQGAFASRLWHDAIVNADQLDGSPRSLANAVLNFFLVIEHIANNLTRQRSGPVETPAASAELRRIIDKLERALTDAAATQERKVHRIREAATELNRVEVRYLNQKIESAGNRLGVESSMVDAALAIAKLRNTTLSHPGKQPPDSLQETLNLARRSSEAFLAAHLDSLNR